MLSHFLKKYIFFCNVIVCSVQGASLSSGAPALDTAKFNEVIDITQEGKKSKECITFKVCGATTWSGDQMTRLVTVHGESISLVNRMISACPCKTSLGILAKVQCKHTGSMSLDTHFFNRVKRAHLFPFCPMKKTFEHDVIEINARRPLGKGYFECDLVLHILNAESRSAYTQTACVLAIDREQRYLKSDFHGVEKVIMKETRPFETAPEDVIIDTERSPLRSRLPLATNHSIKEEDLTAIACVMAHDYIKEINAQVPLLKIKNDPALALQPVVDNTHAKRFAVSASCVIL